MTHQNNFTAPWCRFYKSLYWWDEHYSTIKDIYSAGVLGMVLESTSNTSALLFDITLLH